MPQQAQGIRPKPNSNRHKHENKVVLKHAFSHLPFKQPSGLQVKTSGSVMCFAKSISSEQNELLAPTKVVKRSSSFKTPTGYSETTPRESEKTVPGIEEATHTTNKIFKAKKLVLKKQGTMASNYSIQSTPNAYATNSVTAHNQNSRSTVKPFKKKLASPKVNESKKKVLTVEIPELEIATQPSNQDDVTPKILMTREENPTC